MGIALVRIAFGVVLLALSLHAFRERARLLPWLRAFFLAPIPATTLGLLRIALLGLLWNQARTARPEWHAALPPELRVPPFGWAILGDLPFHAGAAASARDALVLASAAATLGLFTRVTVPVSALLAVYVFGVPQCFGKVNHGGHARMLAVLALALAPSGDALSLDALVRRLRGHAAPAPSGAYAVPVRAVWLLVGTTYLFPGLWKLLVSGDLWISGEQLQNELYRRWGSAPDFRPWVRVDELPLALPLLGIGTLLFELGFFFAMFERKLRIFAAWSAVGFHLGVAAIMGIRFPPYSPLLVVLEAPDQWGDAPRRLAERVERWTAARLLPLARRLRLPEPSRPFPARDLRPSAVLAGTLLALQVAAGLTKTSSWPVSIYPAFSARKEAAATRPSSTRILLESADGGVRELGPALQKARVASARRVIERLADRATSGTPRTQNREIVLLFRHLGVKVEPGDHVVLLEAEWRLFPLGQQRGLRERVLRRLRVREDGTLSTVSSGSGPELALNE